MGKKTFHVDAPTTLGTAAVFASPHSGRDYPADLLATSVLDRHAIRSSEDAFVEQLFAAAPEYGAPLLSALMPRAYVDLNRAADELDPAVIDGVKRAGHNPRIASGLGVIPRVVSNGRAIYRGKLSLSAAQHRLETVWHPYHATLQGLLDRAKAQFGEAILIDCHSMPHEAVASGLRGGRRAEIVIGDRFGASASGEIVERVEAAFVDAGFSVARNAPFAGAFIAQHYGRPAQHQHVVQVEIDRGLYMDEPAIAPMPAFDAVRERLAGAVAEICAVAGRGARPLAAE